MEMQMLESYKTEGAPEAERKREAWNWGCEDWAETDRADAMGWAALFFWGALVVVAHNTSFRTGFSWWNGWGVFLVGAGVIVLVEALVRLAKPQYRSKWGWTLFWGAAFLAGGLGELGGPVWYALPLVAVAAVILTGAFGRST
jgi:hypothetical protein